MVVLPPVATRKRPIPVNAKLQGEARACIERRLPNISKVVESWELAHSHRDCICESYDQSATRSAEGSSAESPDVKALTRCEGH